MPNINALTIKFSTEFMCYVDGFIAVAVHYADRMYILIVSEDEAECALSAL